MALKKDFVDTCGNSYVDAYIKIIGIEINYVQKILVTNVQWYKDETARRTNKMFIFKDRIIINKDNFDTLFLDLDCDIRDRLYASLKTFDNYTGAVDC